MQLTINTDGASRGNPGLSARSFVIKSTDGVILHQEGKVIGQTTNNIAEYTAVKEALIYVAEYLAKKAPHEIQLLTDSQLVANQLKGLFKIKNESLKEMINQIKELEARVGRVSYQYIPREKNFIADRLCNLALDNFVPE